VRALIRVAGPHFHQFIESTSEEIEGRIMSMGEAEEDVRSRCQVVVVGDQGTGKSSLIIALATDSFPAKPPPVLPPTRLPPDFYPDRVPLTIIDTSSRLLFPGLFSCSLLEIRIFSFSRFSIAFFSILYLKDSVLKLYVSAHTNTETHKNCSNCCWVRSRRMRIVRLLVS